MIELIKGLFIKHKELVMYGIVGLTTTVINIVIFYICRKTGMALVQSNVLAWTIAFIFAFIANKLWVFESKEWTGQKAIKEMLGFLIARLATLFLDSFLMWLFVDTFMLNDLLSKIVVNAIVIVVNYLVSKLLIFK